MYNKSFPKKLMTSSIVNVEKCSHEYKAWQNDLENEGDTEGRDSRLNNRKKNSFMEKGKLGGGVVEFIPFVLLVRGLYSNVSVRVYFKIGHTL